MLLKAVRWLRGYASFSVKGGCPEKFINLAVKENANLWDVKINNGDLYAKVLAADYKLLRKSARKANSKIRVYKKHGFPFIRFRYKKRTGIIAGAVIFIGILWLFSMYVWSINISGNETIPSADILKVMEELGVSCGSLKSRINAPMVKQAAMIKLENVAWMSVNISGSCVNISIKEKAIAPEIIPKGEPCNIVASEDGQIERMETYAGTPTVNLGDAVLKGQLLISGVVENLSGKNSFVNSEGKIFARTKCKLCEKVKLNQIIALDTGKTVKRRKIKILGLEIPFNLWHKIDETYRSEISRTELKFGMVRLPVTIYQEVWHEQACGEKILTPEAAAAEAGFLLSEREKYELSGAQVLETSEESREENGEYIVEKSFLCLKDIAKKEKIEFGSG